MESLSLNLYTSVEEEERRFLEGMEALVDKVRTQLSPRLNLLALEQSVLESFPEEEHSIDGEEILESPRSVGYCDPYNIDPVGPSTSSGNIISLGPSKSREDELLRDSIHASVLKGQTFFPSTPDEIKKDRGVLYEWDFVYENVYPPSLFEGYWPGALVPAMQKLRIEASDIGQVTIGKPSIIDFSSIEQDELFISLGSGVLGMIADGWRYVSPGDANFTLFEEISYLGRNIKYKVICSPHLMQYIPYLRGTMNVHIDKAQGLIKHQIHISTHLCFGWTSGGFASIFAGKSYNAIIAARFRGAIDTIFKQLFDNYPNVI